MNNYDYFHSALLVVWHLTWNTWRQPPRGVFWKRFTLSANVFTKISKLLHFSSSRLRLIFVMLNSYQSILLQKPYWHTINPMTRLVLKATYSNLAVILPRFRPCGRRLGPYLRFSPITYVNLLALLCHALGDCSFRMRYFVRGSLTYSVKRFYCCVR